MTTAAAEARNLVELIAGPLRLGENVKAALGRVAMLTGLGDRRVRALWNGEARRIDAEEMDRLREVALAARTREEVDRAYRAHVARLQACRAAIRLQYQEPTGGVADQQRWLAGRDDRALDQGAA